MAVFPLFQPVLKVNFMVTMWDTPDSNGGGLEGALSTVGSAVLSAATQFVLGGFKSVEGLDASNTLTTYHQGGQNDSELHFFDRASYARIVLQRGVTFNTDLWDWQHQVITGKRKTRKSGTIVLMDTRKLYEVPGLGASLPGMAFPVASWTFHNALPAKLAGPKLDATEGAGAGAVAIEALELHAEKIERVSLALIPGVADLNSVLSGLVGLAGGAALAGASAGATAIAGGF
ncbi:phage tail protein [Paracoccus caeni]|uniref:Phage tail protein n=1 Tax=Paracoccus caeni TaxID=657651 RepID=A0A934VV36_9RHOB|nr:phage tail protein [Paracoccus caeni]MBK4216496.1 phage tail protein [Paracoccus caeni]